MGVWYFEEIARGKTIFKEIIDDDIESRFFKSIKISRKSISYLIELLKSEKIEEILELKKE